MLGQLLVGSLVSAIAIVIHALATVVAIGVARAVGRRRGVYPRLHLMGVMVATVLVLMLAHTLEIVAWSLSYALAGAAPAGSDLLYFAFVNYTTLGYGDVTLSRARCSVLEIETSQFLAVEQHDLALVVADEAEGPEIVQARQRARHRLQRQTEIIGDVAAAHR